MVNSSLVLVSSVLFEHTLKIFNGCSEVQLPSVLMRRWLSDHSLQSKAVGLKVMDCDQRSNTMPQGACTCGQVAKLIFVDSKDPWFVIRDPGKQQALYEG